MSLSPFESGHKEAFPRIFGASIAFHLGLVCLVVILSWSLQDEPQPVIPVFELVNVQQPVRPRPARPRPPQPTPPKPEPTKPQAKPEPKPQVKPELPPEIKPQETPPPEPPTEPVAESAPVEPDMDMPLDMPDFDDMPALRPVGAVDMDPLLQVYLERLVAILMQNFNPPSGMDIKRGTKTSVQFTIERTGQITGIVLRKSSGQAVWDRLSMRAVQIAKVPPLPPNYRAPVLPLVFDFREK